MFKTTIKIQPIINNIQKFMLEIKTFHFQTKNGFYHTKIDLLETNMQKLYDKFSEVYQGFYGKFRIKDYTLKINSITDNNIIPVLEDMIIYLTNVKKILKNDSLVTILDDMINNISQTLYLIRDFE